MFWHVLYAPEPDDVLWIVEGSSRSIHKERKSRKRVVNWRHEKVSQHPPNPNVGYLWCEFSLLPSGLANGSAAWWSELVSAAVCGCGCNMRLACTRYLAITTNLKGGRI